MRVHRLFSMQNFRHIHTVLGPALFGNSAQMGFVGVSHMRIDHVQMPLADRHIARLNDYQSRMMQAWKHLHQFDQLCKTVQITIAAALFQITHEWRAINRGKHLMRAANTHRAFRVARPLGKLAWRFAA